jgi:hypothetical protein
MNTAELREKLAEAHNYASTAAVENKSDNYGAYYAGKAEALLYVIGQLDQILDNESVKA